MSGKSHLVEILLPVSDNAGRQFARAEFDEVSAELSNRFGGATAFVRAPAEGLWENQGERQRDEIVVIETMVQTLDPVWWDAYRKDLEERFRQDQIVIRSHTIRML